MRARGWLNQEDDRCCQVSPAVAGKIGVGAYLLIGFGLVCVERKLQYAVDSFAGLLCRSPRALDTTKGGGGRGSNNSSSIICCRARTSHLFRHGRSQTCIRRLPPPQLVVGCGLLAFFLPACRRVLPLQVSRKNFTYIRSGLTSFKSPTPSKFGSTEYTPCVRRYYCCWSVTEKVLGKLEL